MADNPENPNLPGRPWPGDRAAEVGRLYYLRTPSGHYLAFLLHSERSGSGSKATYGPRLATGYGVTPPLAGGTRHLFTRLTLSELAAYAKAYPPEVTQ